MNWFCCKCSINLHPGPCDAKRIPELGICVLWKFHSFLYSSLVEKYILILCFRISKSRYADSSASTGVAGSQYVIVACWSIHLSSHTHTHTHTHTHVYNKLRTTEWILWHLRSENLLENCWINLIVAKMRYYTWRTEGFSVPIYNVRGVHHLYSRCREFLIAPAHHPIWKMEVLVIFLRLHS